MFKEIDSRKVYNQIIDQIKDSIRRGELKKGMRLPSERSMADQLKVSRATVREAIRSMEIMGLVLCRQGEGNFIANDVENSLVEPMELMFILNQGRINEVNELRNALELEAVKLASGKITRESINKMEELCETIENSSDEQIQALSDKKFHYEIAKASENILIINILNAASSLIETSIKDVRKRILINEDSVAVINDLHRNILNALKKRDEIKAVEAMKQHMDKVISYFHDAELY